MLLYLSISNLRNPKVSFSRKYDILRNLGFITILYGLTGLVAGGLWWAAPPCASWVFMSRGTTQRSVVNPCGNRSLKVKLANRICRRLIYLIHYVTRKQAFFALEQPGTSLMRYYEPLRRCLKEVGAFTVTIPLGALGAVSVKYLASLIS